MDIVALILFMAFQVKHLIIDFYLQTPYMYENKGKVEGWVAPLASHALEHALGTLAILVILNIYSGNQMISYLIFKLTVFDFVTHFIIDRWKATQKVTPQEEIFWTNLGWDQFLHHSVGIFIIFLSLSND